MSWRYPGVEPAGRCDACVEFDRRRAPASRPRRTAAGRKQVLAHGIGQDRRVVQAEMRQHRRQARAATPSPVKRPSSSAPSQPAICFSRVVLPVPLGADQRGRLPCVQGQARSRRRAGGRRAPVAGRCQHQRLQCRRGRRRRLHVPRRWRSSLPGRRGRRVARTCPCSDARQALRRSRRGQPAEGEKGGDQQRLAAAAGVPGREHHAERGERAGEPGQHVEQRKGTAWRERAGFRRVEAGEGRGRARRKVCSACSGTTAASAAPSWRPAARCAFRAEAHPPLTRGMTQTQRQQHDASAAPRSAEAPAVRARRSRRPTPRRRRQEPSPACRRAGAR